MVTSAAGLRADLRAATGDVLGVGAGMLVLGTSFGLLVVNAGLAWWWTPVFSAVVYAGSLEFLLVGLSVVGTPLVAVAVTALLVNARHVVYGLSFPLHRIRSRAGRAYAVFALIDEAYALTATRPAESLTGRRIVATQVLLQLCWVSGGLAGALAGATLALDVPALDFVFVALFVVLAVDAVRAAREATPPLLAAASAVVAHAVAPQQMLLVATVLVVALLLLGHAVRWAGERRA
jgi:4-azaleucine resistance transporter AzlC